MFATKVELEHRQSLAMADIGGTAFAVTRGTLWITQENDTHDVVLGPGDVWMVERDGLTIIEAQNDASFHALGRAFEREWKVAHGTPWWSRAVEALSAMGSRPRFVPYY
jgi:Protein of unknown function (DUF2917)